MDFTTYLIIIAILYCILLFFDTFFKTCAHYPYVQFLKNTGFKISLFRINWSTTFFNRLVLRIGSSRTRMLYYWFEIGLYVSLLLLPIAVGLLLYANYQLIFTQNDNSDNSNDHPVLEPLIPGFNLPASEIGYYTVSLLVCSVVHEFGHALAAVKEDVHLIDMGMNIILFLPIAFVNISTEKLASISQWRILRIMCAGVWHNIVLVAITGVLYSSLPFLMTPFYEINTGVIVTDINVNSHVSGIRGLRENMKITDINGCKVVDEFTWQNCLAATISEKPGYCVSTDLVHELDESGPFVQLANGAWDCCAPNSPTHMCFEYLEEADGVVELPQHICLPGRKIVEESKSYCFVDNRKCPNSLHCIKPLLDNVTSLIVLSSNDEIQVIYIGHPADIFTTVEVSPFIPKFKLFGTSIVMAVNKLLKYVTVFSGGLAVVNILPCMFFDGQHIINSFVIVLFKNKFKKQTITIISLITTILGTLMLFINFVQSLWSMFRVL